MKRPLTENEREHWLAEAECLKPHLQTEVIPMMRRVMFERSPEAYQGWNVVGLANDLGSLDLSYGEMVDIDFGRHIVGTPHLRLSSPGSRIDAPVRLRFLLGEAPIEIALDGEPIKSSMLATSWLQEETLHVEYFPARIVLPRRYAFRYLRIQVDAISPDRCIRLDAIEACMESAVSGFLPPLSTFTERQAKLDITAQHTLRNCLQEVFEDGPKRDRRLWLGDLRLQALANAATFRRFDIVKRCLLLFAGLARSDGLVEACVYHAPCPVPSGNLMADYALLFVPTLLDYTIQSGELDLAHQLGSLAFHQLDMIAGALDDGGRLPHQDAFGWIFIDWAPALDKAGPFLGLALYCLEAGFKLAEKLGDSQTSERLAERLASLRYVASTVWRDSRGRLADSFTGQRSHALVAWMILGGVISREEAKSELQQILSDPSAVPPSGAYLWHHVVHACHFAGNPELGSALMETYWGGMVNRGADTFWEVFHPDDPLFSPYGDPRLNSLCHAWSCTPSWFLRCPSEAASSL